MGLSEMQAAVARLCTDPAARTRWQEDPAAFARDCGLSAGEGAQLAQVEALEPFARSLINKRSREAALHFPRTRARLGAAYHEIFSRFAAETPVARDPARDALAFLASLPDPGAEALAEYAQLRRRLFTPWWRRLFPAGKI